ncbi:MAG TPA: serine/threonine-protein kinase [Ktedonobacterales bacterium]
MMPPHGQPNVAAVQANAPQAPHVPAPVPAPVAPRPNVHHPASAIPQPQPLPSGTLLAGRYRLLGYLGGGGFAHIYDAHDTVLGHRRAIKEAFAQDPNTQRQFQLEAEFVLNARHPNLVRGYAWFEQGGRYYLVMDYVDGPTIEEYAIQHIQAWRRPLAEAQILDWVMPICNAAHALHTQPTPIIHRDIKPANIKLTTAGVPVLIDLGLAKLYTRGSQTIGAALAFTPGYAPPEQYQATGATDARTDVYGLGATLYFLLTGYQPTEAPARIAARALPNPRVLNPGLSAPTEEAVLRAMALDPAERQQTAAELLSALRTARVSLAAGGTGSDASAIPLQVVALNQPNEAKAAEHGIGDVAMPVSTAVADPPGLTALRALPAAVSRLLATRSAPGPEEARAVVAAILGVVFLALSLLAIVAGWALVFVLPALALAALSFSRQTAHSPPELRGVTLATFIIGTGWALVWLVDLVRLTAH